MNVLLTGCSGYVGGIVAPFLSRKTNLYQTSSKGVPAPKYRPCDLRNFDEVLRLSEWIRPDIIVHAAGNKNIKFCETHEADAYAINVTTVENIIKAFGSDVTHIYISSDYVFDGTRGNYTELDEPAPFTAYGRQKLAAEKLFLQCAAKSFIVRLSALFDKNGTFCKFLRGKLQNNEPVECYDDVFYSPTYHKNFVHFLEVLLTHEDFSTGIFHCGGERISRYNFALMYAKHFGFPTDLIRRTKISDSRENFFLRHDISLNSDQSNRLLHITPVKLSDAIKEL